MVNLKLSFPHDKSRGFFMNEWQLDKLTALKSSTNSNITVTEKKRVLILI
jgi:hypothetical protein